MDERGVIGNANWFKDRSDTSRPLFDEWGSADACRKQREESMRGKKRR